ncbi:kinase-like domain-containing protein [Aspergillus crustosus]
MASPDPCSACSWTPERQKYCSYNSNVKLFYSAGDRGAWSLGPTWILKDRGARVPSLEAPNLQFVRDNTSIPVPTVIGAHEENGRSLIIMSRIPGEPLNEAWPKLSTAQKENIAKQTAEYLGQLRSLTSDRIQALDSRPLYSNFLFHTHADWLPHGPLGSNEELWKEMETGLDKTVPEAAHERLRARMPSAAPYTFTHGDLTIVNIMVENGALSGIIDWEAAGYYPAWWEYACTSIGYSDDDTEWKTLLRKYMPDYTAGREFWRDYYHLCSRVTGERAVKFIEETK